MKLLAFIFEQPSYKQNFDILASLCSWGDWFETQFDGSPELRRGPILSNLADIFYDEDSGDGEELQLHPGKPHV